MLWEDNYLAHFGIKGQRWGIRRFQNPDGTLTEEGKKRYGKTEEEVRKNAEVARSEAVRLRRRSDDLNSRILFSNDVANHRARRKAFKAERKADEYDEIIKGFGKVNAKNLLDNCKETKTSNLDKSLDIRRFQNPDGTLTEEGRIRYGYTSDADNKKKKETIKNLTDQMKNLDDLSSQDRKKLSVEAIKQITSKDNDRKDIQDLEWELVTQIDKKSGNWNSQYSVSEGHRKAMKEVNEASDKLDERRKEIKEEIGWQNIPYTDTERRSVTLQMVNNKRRKAQQERLIAALKRDNDYYRLLEAYKKTEGNLVSAVIKDLGFEDTPEVRSALYAYVFNY